MEVTLTDLSFTVWYDSATKEWHARARELPMKLETTAEQPADALAALTRHTEDLLSLVNPDQRLFHTITAADWHFALDRAKVTTNDILLSIKNKSLTTMRDPDQLDVLARLMYDTHGLPNLTQGENFVAATSFIDGYKRGVDAALAAEL